MKYSKCCAMIIVLMFISLTGTLSFADQERDEKKKTYKVTITNLTRDQVFSPPIVINHVRDFSLFTPGEAASDELAALAEGGDTDPLADLIYGIYPFEVAGGPVPPGAGWRLDSPARIPDLPARDGRRAHRQPLCVCRRSLRFAATAVELPVGG